VGWGGVLHQWTYSAATDGSVDALPGAMLVEVVAVADQLSLVQGVQASASVLSF